MNRKNSPPLEGRLSPRELVGLPLIGRDRGEPACFSYARDRYGAYETLAKPRDGLPRIQLALDLINKLYQVERAVRGASLDAVLAAR